MRRCLCGLKHVAGRNAIDEMAAAPSTTVNIDGIAAIKLPPFWKARPMLWFARAEA